MKIGRLLYDTDFTPPSEPNDGPLASYYTSERWERGSLVVVAAEHNRDEGTFFKVHPWWRERVHEEWTAFVPASEVDLVSPLQLLAEQAE